MVSPPITPEAVLFISKESCGDASPIPTLLFVELTYKVFVSTVRSPVVEIFPVVVSTISFAKLAPVRVELSISDDVIELSSMLDEIIVSSPITVTLTGGLPRYDAILSDLHYT